MNNKDKVILHLCVTDGSDSIEYHNNGYTVILIGLPDYDVTKYSVSQSGILTFQGQNGNPELHIEMKTIYGIIANPVCRDFSQALTKSKIPRDLKRGMVLVKHCYDIIWECQYRIEQEHQKVSPLKFWVIENPATGSLKWFLGKPIFTYCPSEYGGSFTKKTGLWGYFNMPKRPILFNPLPKGRSLGGHYEGNKKIAFNSDKKSICNINFAKTFYEANQ